VNLYRATILEEGQSGTIYNWEGLKERHAVASSRMEAARLIAGSIGMTEHIDTVVCVEENVLVSDGWLTEELSRVGYGTEG